MLVAAAGVGESALMDAVLDSPGSAMSEQQKPKCKGTWRGHGWAGIYTY